MPPRDLGVVAAVVVTEHPLRKLPVAGGLHLGVDQQELTSAGEPAHPEERIRADRRSAALSRDLPQLGFEDLEAVLPDDVRMGLGEEEFEEGAEEAVHGFPPGTVEMIGPAAGLGGLGFAEGNIGFLRKRTPVDATSLFYLRTLEGLLFGPASPHSVKMANSVKGADADFRGG